MFSGLHGIHVECRDVEHKQRSSWLPGSPPCNWGYQCSQRQGRAMLFRWQQHTQ
jgi:hypothetical protein